MCWGKVVVAGRWSEWLKRHKQNFMNFIFIERWDILKEGSQAGFSNKSEGFMICVLSAGGIFSNRVLKQGA